MRLFWFRGKYHQHTLHYFSYFCYWHVAERAPKDFLLHRCGLTFSHVSYHALVHAFKRCQIGGTRATYRRVL